MKIQDIIDKFNKLTPEDIDDYNKAQTFVEENESLYHDCLYNEPMLDLSKEKVEQFLKSSLTSLLDSLVEEIREQGCYTQITLSSGKKVNLISKEEVINIINSHR